MTRLTKLFSVAAVSLAMGAFTSSAHDLVPAKAQTQPILLKNATVHTVTQGTMQTADVLLVQGKISAVGQVTSIPENTKTIDLSGKHIYPGLIALSSTLGLTEVSAVRATRDMSEVGQVNPDVKAKVAFNADSELIPTVRSNGITHVQIVPQGRLLTGLSSVVHLDGWNWTDSVVKANEGVHLQWPRAGINNAWWEKRSPAKQREQQQKSLDKLDEYFVSARAYYNAYKADNSIAVDSRWHAMMPLFERKVPLYIHADDKRQIEQAVRFAKSNELDMIIVGGKDAWRTTKLLTDNNISVIYESAFGLPSRVDEDIDQAYKTPKMLADANVGFAITIPGDWGSRSLPFAVGQAMNYGLTPAQALAAVTIEPAKLLGLSQSMGSIEVGKNANIVVSEGDLFDYTGHQVSHMFIDGRAVDLDNRHKRLYNKYQQKTE